MKARTTHILQPVSKYAGLVLVMIALTGCISNAENKPKETLGKILGAGLGALAGSQIGGGKGKLAAVAVGAIAGTWFGGELGQSLDKVDKLYMAQTTQYSLEKEKTGTTSTWTNPDTGNSGTITPLETYQKSDAKNCRTFEQTIYVDGKEETALGRACRQANGTWKIAS
ncbi:MAG: hypothetical protein CBB68_07975 [Rhodospirillaceae bacterium TMED8]|nr:hypothetical protein [Magnetovibrio sp.]OUT50913.1 MAG: hypothetical protein CBB68_07975 [Rhodospirillaceae bacterium TMED8]|tara:strand:+ start:341 stop:847 length:507 start_codon:yes stop_codon:yes gene_type:complete